VIDPELLTYVPDAVVIPRAIDLSEFPYEPVADTDVPVIVHAPTNRTIKGTDIIIAAIEELRAEGVPLELRLVENIPQAEARDIYRGADIVIDQVRIGWYGVLAVEAMALGKPVMSYIREDLLSSLPSPLPLAATSPVTLKDDLRKLLNSYQLRRELATRGRAYVEEVHGSDRVAAQYRDLYESVMKDSRPIDIAGTIPFLRHQADQVHRLLRQAAKQAQRDAASGIWGAKTPIKLAKTGKVTAPIKLVKTVKRPSIGQKVQHIRQIYAHGGLAELLKFLRYQVGKRMMQ